MDWQTEQENERKMYGFCRYSESKIKLIWFLTIIINTTLNAEKISNRRNRRTLLSPMYVTNELWWFNIDPISNDHSSMVKCIGLSGVFRLRRFDSLCLFKYPPTRGHLLHIRFVLEGVCWNARQHWQVVVQIKLSADTGLTVSRS